VSSAIFYTRSPCKRDGISRNVSRRLVKGLTTLHRVTTLRVFSFQVIVAKKEGLLHHVLRNIVNIKFYFTVLLFTHISQTFSEVTTTIAVFVPRLFSSTRIGYSISQRNCFYRSPVVSLPIRDHANRYDCSELHKTRRGAPASLLTIIQTREPEYANAAWHIDLTKAPKNPLFP